MKNVKGWLLGLLFSSFMFVMLGIDIYSVGFNPINTTAIILLGCSTSACMFMSIKIIYEEWNS